MFGSGSLGAAIAIKEMIEQGKISGTIKFFGTPSEEKYFGKIWMVEAGLWDDVDVNVSWHPGANTEADVQSSLALIDFKVEFFGQAAHASVDPWNGRSASDALELYTTGINYYREHIKPTVRINKKTIIEEKPNRPIFPREIAQGNKNAISRSKIINKIATK